jgi:hypothetical protein
MRPGKENTVTLELANAALRLARGQTLKVRDGAGTTICAREGVIWITEENSPQDVVLEPGACYRLARPGLAVVQAFGEAALTLQ